MENEKINFLKSKNQKFYTGSLTGSHSEILKFFTLTEISQWIVLIAEISIQRLNSQVEFVEPDDAFRKIKLQLLKCAKMKASKIRPNPKIDLLEKVQKEFRESQIKNAKSN